MSTGQITRLTRETAAQVAAGMSELEPELYDGPERREHQRWQAPGTVVLHDAHYSSKPVQAGTIRNFSEGGLGMSCEAYREPGSIIEIVAHLPDVTFAVRAEVRYCELVRGQHMMGLAFIFD